MSVEPGLVGSRPALVRLVPIDPSAADTRLELDQAVTVLGSGDECDLILTSNKVDAAHAAVVLLGNGAYLCDLGAPGGTTLNGRRVRWARLANGDEMGVGPCRFRIELEGSAAFGIGEEPPFSLGNEAVVGVVGSIDPALVVGSDPGCDVVLHCGSVAPRHCLVVWTHEGPVVRSLQREDHVRLNGRRIGFGRLMNGDSIGVGPVELTFEANLEGASSNEGRRAREPAPLPSHSKSKLTAAALAAGRLASSGVTALRGLWPDAGATDDRPTDRVAGIPEPGGGACRSSGREPKDRAFWEAPRRAARIPEAVGEGVRGATAPAGLDAAGRRASSSEAFAPGALEERSRELDQRVTAWRTRVGAAQRALDERARHHREDLNRERAHLQSIQADLQRQAERLLRFAGEDCLLQASSREGTAGPDSAAVVPRPVSEARPEPPVALEQRTRELTEVVLKARDEIDCAERRLDSLGADIGRLRAVVARTRKRHQARDSELAVRSRALEKDQQTQGRKREELSLKARELDVQEAALGAQISEAEQRREDLELEGRRLAEARAALDERRQDLRKGLEGARQRLRACHAELQSKQAELAKATHQKRRSIEAEISRQRAELDLQEAELKARRAALASAGPEALDRTARELSEVLDVGLGGLETELRERQAGLDARVSELLEESESGAWFRAGSGGAVAGSPGQKPRGVAERCPGDTDQRPLRAEGPLETLFDEIVALQDALALPDDRGDGLPPEHESEEAEPADGRPLDGHGRRRSETHSVPAGTRAASVPGGRAAGARDDGVWSY